MLTTSVKLVFVQPPLQEEQVSGGNVMKTTLKMLI